MKKLILLIVLAGNCIMANAGEKLRDEEALKKKIDSLITAKYGVDDPGVAVSVVQNGEVIYKKVYGMMNLDYSLAISENTVFNLASVSKHITAFGLLLLENEGKLDLDDPVRKYIPELPEYEYEVTLNQLIHHTSGISSTDNVRLFAGQSLEAPWEMEDELQAIFRYKQLNFKPGEEFIYSNGGYSLLATVIERVSGQSLDGFFRTNVFEPLQMNDAYVYGSLGEIIPNRAVGYQKKKESWKKMFTDADAVAGASNFYFSTNDMIAWSKNFFDPVVGTPTMMEKFFTPNFILNNGDKLPYAYGMNQMLYKGQKRSAHRGDTMGFTAYLMLFPEHELAISILSNDMGLNSSQMAVQISEWAIGDYFTEEEIVESEVDQKVELTPEELNRFTGQFKMVDGTVFTFIEKEGALVLQIPDAPDFELHAIASNKFNLPQINAQTEFVIEASGEVNMMIWHQGGKDYPAPKFNGDEKIEVPALGDFVGDYYSENLDVRYKIVQVDDQLILILPKTFETYLGLGDLPMDHVEGDDFKVERLGLITFSRDEKGEIQNFVIKDVGRLRNIGFVKL